ncbi:sigma-54-dependent transcriptional regulator [Thermodesulfobacteriota bacterium]
MTPPEETILIVEDEELARRNLVHILEKEGYAVISVNSGMAALDLLRQRTFGLVLTDLRMEKVDGMQVLKKTQELQPHTEVVMITGYATVDSAVNAMREGAYHYVAKPYKIDEVRKIAAEALLKRRLQLENLQLRETLREVRQIPHILGKSESINSVLETIRQISSSDTNVLILGESGTGKELAAKAIHSLSPRSEKRFVAFNCGSFTDELMANELFGHEKGAFTGATNEKVGLLQAADGGTVFLDEIGDMPPSMQVRLLRVIQEKNLLRVGGVDPIPVDVRFIAATHRALQEDVQEGRFRQDLYYRLNVIAIHLPPLTDRDGDIPLLAQHFLSQKNAAMKKNVCGIDREAMELLCEYSWPGNVRELENVIERAVALENGPVIRADDLPEYISQLSIETYRRRASGIPTLEEQEKNYIRWVLEKYEGNKTKAAKMMGVDRVTLWRKMKRYGLE